MLKYKIYRTSLYLLSAK